MKVTLLLPQDISNRFSLYQARRSARVLPQSLINLIYQLVAKPCAWLLTTRMNFLLSFPLHSRVEQHSLLSWRSFSPFFFLPYLHLSSELLPLLPSLERFCGSKSLTRGQVWNPYRWVPYPISSLTPKESLPTTSLTGNSFWGQRIVEKLQPVKYWFGEGHLNHSWFPSPSFS
jgi:hypothetical protein